MSVWEGDLLGFEEIGSTFGNLVKSIDDTKVISIEAGYGRGKTFFRERWAKHLRAEGEVVVEVDALLSDHSGDPVLTFIAALVAALPEGETATGKQLLEKSKKFGGVALRSVLRLGLRQGADEVIDLVTGEASGAIGDDKEALQDAVEEFGDGLSKMAGDLIAAQVMAERVRTQEIPEQLKALRDALTKDAENKRVVILVDELDRCHPDYAIAFLEAMKLVFDLDGFVFCLMVNADYLQRVADHRFGKLGNGEQYLDKFVDIRLKLLPHGTPIRTAIEQLTLELPLSVPYGDDPEFGVDRAAKLAGSLAAESGFSMRQVKRALSKVDLALRCYRTEPIDCSLLVYLALQECSNISLGKDFLPRVQIHPDVLDQFSKADPRSIDEQQMRDYEKYEFLEDNCPELLSLPEERYRMKTPERGKSWKNWVPVMKYLAAHYIPSHQAMLDAVHRFDAEV